MKKINLKSNSMIFEYIAFAVICTILLILAIIKPNEPYIGTVSQILLVILTGLYVFETHRVVEKNSESVEATKELIRVTIKPQEDRRKSLAKNLLLEVHKNNNLAKKIFADFKIISETKTRLDPVSKPDFAFKVFDFFAKLSLEIDFKNEDTAPLIRRYYEILKETKEYVELYNLNSGDNFKQNNIHFVQALVFITTVKNDGLKLFTALEKESDFKYSKKDYFYEYEPFDLEKYLDGKDKPKNKLKIINK